MILLDEKQAGGAVREGSTHRNATHGESGSRLYTIWRGMRARCSNPKQKFWPRYGGRGIRVCADWQDFVSFRQWAAANGYSENLTIERIDNDGDYEPSNCRWATNIQQQRNKVSNRLVTFAGKKAPLAEHAEAVGIPYDIVHQRLQVCGWSVARALETPVLSRAARARAWRQRAQEEI